MEDNLFFLRGNFLSDWNRHLSFSAIWKRRTPEIVPLLGRSSSLWRGQNGVAGILKKGFQFLLYRHLAMVIPRRVYLEGSPINPLSNY